MRLFLPALLMICYLGTINAQPASELLEKIKKLNVLGSVLYVAAHPDDENTRLISNLSKDQKLRTAYVSLTRGDGGQNLIGAELDEFLGVIRTNELLQARRIDGGIQYFTRANDFGYSKNAEETFSIWNKDSILLDVMRVIRTFKPDVIISRFDYRTSGKTHGHHTASAILAKEAFEKSSSGLFMNQSLSDLEPVTVSRLFFNTSYFFWGSKEKFDAADKSDLYSLDVGTYFPALGYSNNEIAALSRSMHKSQGFGINSSRGVSMEYFERIDQKKNPREQSPFDGLDFTWNRVNGGGNIQKIIDQVIGEFDVNVPSKSIPLLQKAEKYIAELSPGHWRDIKLKDIQEIIFQCAGLYTEGFVDKQVLSSGATIKLNTEIIHRSQTNIKLQSIVVQPMVLDTTFNSQLVNNKANYWSAMITIPQAESTAPFWLFNGRGNAVYTFDHPKTSILPESDRKLRIQFNVLINEIPYSISKPIIFKNDDPVLGEIRQPLDIIPAVIIKPFDPLVLVPQGKNADFSFTIKSNVRQQKGIISFEAPDGIVIEPSTIPYHFIDSSGEFKIQIKIKSLIKNNRLDEIKILNNGEKLFTHSTIKYNHIPWQNVLIPSKIKVSALDLKIKQKRIAYINGAGDYIDEALIKMGYKVDVIPSSNLNFVNNKNYDVLVFGIRALNNQEDLTNCKESIINFAKNGGKVIFQYNTAHELVTQNFVPGEFKISRDRVTNEKAEVRILIAKHPVFHQPNKIESSDFNDWVQERGLYFPSTYDNTYEELLSMNDPDEKPLKSGILCHKEGKGYIIYTPLAWFRQLPAGVPGAYRLFSNIISY